MQERNSLVAKLVCCIGKIKYVFITMAALVERESALKIGASKTSQQVEAGKPSSNDQTPCSKIFQHHLNSPTTRASNWHLAPNKEGQKETKGKNQNTTIEHATSWWLLAMGLLTATEESGLAQTRWWITNDVMWCGGCAASWFLMFTEENHKQHLPHTAHKTCMSTRASSRSMLTIDDNEKSELNSHCEEQPCFDENGAHPRSRSCSASVSSQHPQREPFRTPVRQVGPHPCLPVSQDGDPSMNGSCHKRSGHCSKCSALVNLS